MRILWSLLLFAAWMAPAPTPARAQDRDTTLFRRWVGTRANSTLTIEFYGDTMLVVGDRHALYYRLTPDSLVATGDTNFAVSYRLSFGRLLLQPADGDIITMSPQNTLGRPLVGHWVGDIDTSGTTHVAELWLDGQRGARWRSMPSGKWDTGEWDRQTRKVTMTWEKSGEWMGLYDPQRNTLLLEPATDSTGTALPGGATGVLRRVFR